MVADLPDCSCIHRIIVCMGGCLGVGKSTPIISVDEPSKGLRIQGRAVNKNSISEDLWSTSTCGGDMDATLHFPSAFSSYRTPTTAAAPLPDSVHQSDFLNTGLKLWNETRLQWVGGQKQSDGRSEQIREPRISWNTSYQSLLGTNKRFRNPIPLAEMIDFLVDVWEQEGLYD